MTKAKVSPEKYFKLLKLEPGAGLDELKRAYRKRVKAWHPDKLPSTSKRLQKLAHDKLHEIDVAYKALGEYIRKEAKKTGEKTPFRRRTEAVCAKGWSSFSSSCPLS